MSFHQKGGSNPKKKVLSHRRPVWDDSVHDLTVYRATPDEILMRKEAHKSKNHMSVKLEQMRKERQKSRLTGREAQQLAIMKEVLFDQQQLQKIVTKSDQMMAVVKDLFGDDAKRFTGHPNVTTAPETSMGSGIASVPEISTFTESLNNADINPYGPNDVDISSSDEEDELDQPATISFESKLNLSKFQQYLLEEQSKLDHQDPGNCLVTQQNQRLDSGSGFKKTPESTTLNSNFLQIMGKVLPVKDQHQPSLSSSVIAMTEDGLKTPLKSQLINGQMSREQRSHSAINDTNKVKKTMKQISSPTHREAADSSTTDFRKALQDLEKELRIYENQVGLCPQEEKDQAQTFSSYTVALIDAVSRLTRYLKETELRLKMEISLREQLTEDVFQLRAIIDALATDIITTQEEYAKLYADNQRYRQTIAKITTDLKNEMQEIRELIPGQLPRPNNTEKAEQTQNEAESTGKGIDSCSSKAFSPVCNELKDEDPASLKTSKEDKSICTTAIMLSPPVRKTRMVNDVKQAKVTTEILETISIPRPTPLVQSNLAAELMSVAPSLDPDDMSKASDQECGTASLQDLIRMGDQTQGKLNDLQEMAVEEALKNPDLQELIQTQITELNQQQEEATKRLEDLLANQKLQQQHLQDKLESNVILDSQFSPTNGHFHQISHSQVSPSISPIF